LRKFDQLQITGISTLLSLPRKIVVTSHYNPDGDALGSSFALTAILRKAGHSVTTIIPNDYPDFLNWMPGSSEAVIYFHASKKSDILLRDAEIIFSLDYNAFSRVNLFTEQLSKSEAVKVLIDHHLEPENTFDYSFSIVETSSTSELVYDFIQAVGLTELIDKQIATCLYVGIMTDTGSFSYACNYPETYQIVANLVQKGIDTERIHRLVYDTYSESRMRLLGYCLAEKMVVLPQLHTAYIWLTMSDLERFKFQPGDTEGVVNYALSIRDISLAALFTEKNDRVRISFRSKGSFSVNTFAREHFSGGGHRNAAGGDSFLNMDATLQKFEELLSNYSNQLNHAAAEAASTDFI